MKIKIAGVLNDAQQLAVSRAKAYHGKQPYQEFFADCIIWYKNGWAAAPTTNAIARYGSLAWADVIATANAANTLIRPPAEGQTDTRTPDQKLQYAIQTAI